ncbi:LLM class flavin-dependent oxidoreductase [Methylopila musalis]|uniref:LLM class flavin-dependent oxidoreductase n=1 Tax=Methylopila musalis TaxID=1134781 RepID=A0ABW3Z3D6_9HYPH
MPVGYRGRQIEIHTINTRTSDPEVYWRDFSALVRLTEQSGFDGMLCFSANETLIDPWLAAHYLIMNSRRLTPIVAVNPIYMHPYAAAKMVSSFAYMHGRRAALNLITGTAQRDREVLHDAIEHDDRYARLTEYAEIVQALLTQPRLTDFRGRHYDLTQAIILPQPPEPLRPTFLVAGHSPAAEATAQAVGAVRLRMLAPELEDGLPSAASGLGAHFGVVARETEEEAWAAARRRYPDAPELEGMLEFVMDESDSAWKRILYERVIARGAARPGYWLEPFGQLRADCPYFVGSYEAAAASLAAHVERGVDWFILDLPPEEDEFVHAAKAFAMAFERLGIDRAEAA